MDIERYYLGWQLGERAAVALLKVCGATAHPVVQWATAASEVAADIPYDALLACLDRLGCPQLCPTALAVARPEGAGAGQAFDRIRRVYSLSPVVCDPLHALGACAAFLSSARPKAAVVVADAGLLIGSLGEQGLEIDLQVDAPSNEGESEHGTLGRGPWPLFAELARTLERGGARETLCAGDSYGCGSSPEFPSTQLGLRAGYPELLERLRAVLALGDDQQRSAARSWVERLVARDVAVLQKTARDRHPGVQVLSTGRLLESGAATLPFEEQLALGAAVLSAWADLGTTQGDVRTVPVPPSATGLRVDASKPGTCRSSASIASFAELFTSRQRREAFLEHVWGRASAHLSGVIEPHALLTGDEFLAGVARAYELNPNPAPNLEGISVLAALKNGKQQFPVPGARPYPRQWQGPLGSNWQAAHLLMAATERSGCEPWDASLRLASAHHVCPRLTTLVLSFFEFFESHCWVNAYYSPARAVRGLACHADGTDVFVCQIEGEKHWTFDAAPLQNAPLRAQYLRRVNAGEAKLDRECVLRAGDLLYLPAGTCHAALATTSPSLHLTFAVRRHTALRVRKWWAQRSGKPEELNQSVQRYDAERGRIRMNEAAAHAYVGSAETAASAAEMLSAYCRESLQIDREATLLGRLLPSIDHV